MSSKKKISVFLFCALILHMVLLVINNRLLKESRIGELERTQASLPNSDFTLVLGNSHAAAVLTEFLDNAHNLASYGESLHKSYYRLVDVVKRDGNKPANLILSFDLGIMENRADFKDPNQYYWNTLENSGELARFVDNKFAFFNHRLSSKVIPYKNLDVVLFDYFFAKRSPVGALRPSTSLVERSIKERAPTPEGLVAQLSPYGKYYLRQTLKLAREHNIRVLLVRFPVTQRHYVEKSNNFEPSLFYREAHSIASKELDNVKILDLHDRFEESEFRDPDHLRGGAPRQRMTQLIAEKLKTL